jgi:aldehyde:ferredoxin oxidoreductase
MDLAKKLQDQGLLPGEKTFPKISLDSLASMEAWAGMISRAEGLGEVLGQGFKGMLAEFGEESTGQAPPLIKGMMPYTGPRGPVVWDLFGTQELGQVLDPRGPHVGASGSPTYFSRRPLEVFPGHLDRMGASPEAIERVLPGAKTGKQALRVGRLLKYSQRWFAILGCLGVCARGQVNRFYSAKLLTDLYQAVTGLETDLEGIRKGADRVWTLLRLANLREGFSRSDDCLPRQWFEEPGFKDYVTGQPARAEDAERMIEDYYEEQGWDPKTGVPTRECLEGLGLFFS